LREGFLNLGNELRLHVDNGGAKEWAAIVFDAAGVCPDVGECEAKAGIFAE
jgi:hypothetical protein